MSDKEPVHGMGVILTPEQEAENQKRKAELIQKFEELKKRAEEERGGKQYTTKEVLEMIMRERDDT